jgi:hypothetical protein
MNQDNKTLESYILIKDLNLLILKEDSLSNDKF